MSFFQVSEIASWQAAAFLKLKSAFRESRKAHTLSPVDRVRNPASPLPRFVGGQLWLQVVLGGPVLRSNFQVFLRRWRRS